MGRVFKLGWKTEPERIEEMPNTSPLCINKPKEPLKRSRAPKEVCTGVNIIGTRYIDQM
jgi:hypothetical protein